MSASAPTTSLAVAQHRSQQLEADIGLAPERFRVLTRGSARLGRSTSDICSARCSTGSGCRISGSRCWC